MENWKLLHIRDVNDSLADFVMEELAGAKAITVWSEQPDEAPLPDVKAIFGDVVEDSEIFRILNDISARCEEYIGAKLSDNYGISPVSEKDWENSWKDFFYPVEIPPFVIKPTWRDYDNTNNYKVIHLDPGMAFGTGGHATTSLCLSLLGEIVRPGDKVLDLGCGSGILAIGAALLGAEVVAVDNDPLAVRVSDENIALNNLEGKIKTILINKLDEIPGKYTVIVANILAEVLQEMAPELPSLMEDNGQLISSGIIKAKLDPTAAVYAKNGMRVTHSQTLDNWGVLVSVKN